jgi:hypothetical protein
MMIVVADEDMNENMTIVVVVEARMEVDEDTIEDVTGLLLRIGTIAVVTAIVATARALEETCVRVRFSSPYIYAGIERCVGLGDERSRNVCGEAAMFA